MAKRQPDVDEMAKRFERQIERIAKLSPSMLELFENWIDCMLAGEPLEDIKPEMDRLAAIVNARKKRR